MNNLTSPQRWGSGVGWPSVLFDQWPDDVFKDLQPSLLYLCTANHSGNFILRLVLYVASWWLPATIKFTSCLLMSFGKKSDFLGLSSEHKKSFSKASGSSLIMFPCPELGHMLILESVTVKEDGFTLGPVRLLPRIEGVIKLSWDTCYMWYIPKCNWCFLGKEEGKWVLGSNHQCPLSFLSNSERRWFQKTRKPGTFSRHEVFTGVRLIEFIEQWEKGRQCSIPGFETLISQLPTKL